MRALAANERDLRLVDLLKIQHILLGHRDTSEAAVFPRTAVADRITGASRSAEPLVEHVLIPDCPPSGESADHSAQPDGARPRPSSAPSTRTRTAGPASGPTSPRPPHLNNNTRTLRPPFPRTVTPADDSAP
ncbi:hypothetical protein GCM10009654_23330 [Streptomyces hebeiensis]|uniref:Uncharacterized protein n=1 Tax=Streptomyces hebeiensis TaxID=229486 RepID=A0ABN1UUH5_9ACTN